MIPEPKDSPLPLSVTFGRRANGEVEARLSAETGNYRTRVTVASLTCDGDNADPAEVIRALLREAVER